MKKLFLFLFAFIFYKAFAQNFPVKNYTINDGLPSNSIRCIYKDSRGLLWIGTDAGLCCFDGVNYTVYNELTGLKHNSIWSIAEDNEHNLWISLYGAGLAKFDGKKFTYFDKTNGLINNGIRKIVYSKKNNCLILGTEKGLSLFDGKQFRSFSRNSLNTNFQITGIDEYNDDYLITSSYHGVFKLHLQTGIKEARLDSLFYFNAVYSSTIDGNTYYGGDASHNLISRDLVSGQTKYTPCPITWGFAKTHKGLILATCNITSPDGGLFMFRDNSITEISNLCGITTPNLWCAYFDDKSQTLWVGSMDNGLFKVDLSDRILLYPASHFGLDELRVQALLNDNENNLWLGGQNYIIKITESKKIIVLNKEEILKRIKQFWSSLKIKPNYDQELPPRKTVEGFSSFNITTDKENNIWVSTTWGLICFNQDLTVKAFHGSDGGHIGFDDKDQLFFGHMYDHINLLKNKFDYKNSIVYLVKDKSTPRDIIKIVRIKNTLWFASYTAGLYCWNGTQFKKIKKTDFKESILTDLTTDSKNNLIIGTNNGRVYILKPFADSLKVLKIYNPGIDFKGSTIHFVEKKNEILFIGTNKGINLIRNDSLIFFINKSDGIADNQFNDCVMDKYGNIWIGTNNGLICINKIKKQIPKENKINILSILINGNSLPAIDSSVNWNIVNKEKLELPFNMNEVEILLGSNYPTFGEKNEYKFRLSGISENWSKIENNSIHLRGLQPDYYTIEIAGFNLSTGEKLSPLKFELRINPPFYKSWWFILFLITIILLLVYLLYLSRINSIKKQEKEKAELVNKLMETRLEALRAQMNPHFTFNAINSIQNFIIDNNTSEALHYLSEFSKLIRQTLDNANEKLMPLQTEINFLTSYINIQRMRFENVNTTITVDPLLDIFNIQIPPLIIQPIIENAFEHAFTAEPNSANFINVYFQKSNDALLIIVQDNGIGIQPEKQNILHQSKGLLLIRQRLDLLNKEYNSSSFYIEINNREISGANGTQTKITMPIIMN